jgi:ubiquinone/menaquinone biosynthesis C-methylase UbiE
MKRKTTDYTNQHVASKFGRTPLVHAEIGRPSLIKFVGKVRGLDIIDIGCGPGFITNELHKRGARCLGVDPSAAFISHASQTYPTIPFVRAKGSRIKNAKSTSFDRAILSMVLVNVESQSEFGGIFREAARLLRTRGELIILALHPLVVRNFRDSLRDVQLPAGKGYLSPRLRFSNRARLSDGSRIEFMNCSWTLEAISHQLKRNSFVITEMKEPAPNGRKHLKLLRDTILTPHYILIRARKEP